MKARPLSKPSLGFAGATGPAHSSSAQHQLLVIGSAEEQVGLLDLDGARIERASWRDFTTSMLTARGIDLIVPIVEMFDRATAAFFELCSKPGVAHPPILAILPADFSDHEHLVAAVTSADDFLILPVRAAEWRERVSRLVGISACEPRAVVDKLTIDLGLSQLIGRDASFLKVVEKVPLVARSGRPALITGETGTGKELFAHAIHSLSPRRNMPFIPVDCGALPDTLFENELFGHVRGAFTDAHRDQRGLVALAEGGTLFLDEVDSLSLAAQAKLLRFLEERSDRPLGSDRFVRSDVTVLAAMNRNPERLVQDKALRADLFFRINVVRLHLMPLRERRADVPWLARHVLARFAAESGEGLKSLSPAVLAKLMAYDWPGNVRELSNVLQRSIVLAADRRLLPEDIQLPDANATDPMAPGVPDSAILSYRYGRSLVLEEFERSVRRETLRETWRKCHPRRPRSPEGSPGVRSAPQETRDQKIERPLSASGSLPTRHRDASVPPPDPRDPRTPRNQCGADNPGLVALFVARKVKSCKA